MALEQCHQLWQPAFLANNGETDDLCEVGRDQGIANHPTQKPVEIVIRAIENSSLTGDIVYDGFLGSGTTLIGAETTGRICYGTEFTPRYCDVIGNRDCQYIGDRRVIRNGDSLSGRLPTGNGLKKVFPLKQFCTRVDDKQPSIRKVFAGALGTKLRPPFGCLLVPFFLTSSGMMISTTPRGEARAHS